MAILLTNGTYYIAHSRSGAVIKVSDIDKAQNFYSIERAINQKNKTPGKCAGYYFIDTDKMLSDTKEKKTKRKIFSIQERDYIYQKTEGRCYLCGEFVPFDSFEIEHYVPLSKGGTNDMGNLFCACHCCNTIKRDVYPDAFMGKVLQIFMYQMDLRYKGDLNWEVAQMMLNEMV